MPSLKLPFRRGDTIIEVLFALSIFSLASILAINSMNGGINSAQASLEETMVRNEINAQAEALRFVHSYMTLGGGKDNPDDPLLQLWNRLTTERVADSLEGYTYPPENVTCDDYYNGANARFLKQHAFILNPRNIMATNALIPFNDTRKSDGQPYFRPSGNYARVLYDDSTQLHTSNSRDIQFVEGLWVIPVRGDRDTKDSGVHRFYDFYIHSCWYSAGKSAPTSIGTVIRLYNPSIAGGGS